MGDDSKLDNLKVSGDAEYLSFYNNKTDETNTKGNRSLGCPAEPLMGYWLMFGGSVCVYVGIGLFCAARKKFGHGCSRFALVHLIVYSALLIAGTVWSINILVSRDCTVEIVNATLPFLIVQWILFLIGLLCIKFRLEFGDVYLTKTGMIITAVILTVLLLTPSIAFLVLRNSECAAFIPLWDMTSSFTPILLAVFVQAINANKSSVRILASFAYLLYMIWFIIGTGFIMKAYAEHNVVCHVLLNSASVLICSMCLVMGIVAFCILAPRIPTIFSDMKEIISKWFSKRHGKTDSGVDEKSGKERKPRRERTTVYCEHKFRQPTAIPSYWSNFPQGNTEELLMEYKNAGYKLLDIDENMYKIIETAVLGTWQSDKVGRGKDARGINADSGIQVINIQRIENLKLFHNYALERKKIFGKRAAGTTMTTLENISGSTGPIITTSLLNSYFMTDLYPDLNECFLFHGTKADVLESVLKQGLDMRLSSETSMFGRGVYLAESSTKSDQYTDKGSRDQNFKTMLLVRACLGCMCVLHEPIKLRRPPCEEQSCRKDDCEHEARHDSVVADGRWIFREFILYDLNRCYPEFVITYVRT